MRAAPPPQKNVRNGLLVALALAAFSLALYARLLFTDRVLATGDILLYFYPYRDYAAQALREARLPLWNPYIFMGVPFLANPQAAVLYPLHWPLSWLDVTRQIAWSAALHAWLIGFGGALFARRLGLRWNGALITGLVLAGSGYVGGLIGHINQLNGVAWLPWALLLVTPPAVTGRRGNLLVDSALLGLVIALMLLSGHTQTAYINLVGVGIWAVSLGFLGWWQAHPRSWQAWQWRPFATLAIGSAVGALLAAPQLLPTLELSGQGIRNAGLSFLEATSFSLNPLRLPWTLFPTYGVANLEALFDTPAFTEFVAWLGVLGLALAVAGVWKGRGLARVCGILFVILGLALALGRWNPLYALLYAVVPGFDLFRTPARWIMLYTLGGAILAGLGADALVRLWVDSGRPARWLQTLIPVALALELLIATTALPHTHPTAAQAVNSVRTAPAHLLTDPQRATLDEAAAPRYLGMSTITYDPGDAADYHRRLVEEAARPLSERAFSDFVIALKVQELLVPNLSLLWHIPAVDGYDGGVLPLQRYNLLASLLMPEGVEASDGRLREQIRDVPNKSLLDLLNVGYVVTDKVRDLWYEDVYYDRQIGADLTADAPLTTVTVPQPFEATHVDLIASLAGDTDALAEGIRTVGRVRVRPSAGVASNLGEEFALTAGSAPGALLADGLLDSPIAAASGATVAYRDVEGGHQEYRVRLPLEQPTSPARIDVRLTDPSLELQVRAMTLLDERTGMFVPLLPSDRGDFALAHSGDVKIYESQWPLPRAYLAPSTQVVATPEEAAAHLRRGVDPSQSAIVEGGPVLSGTLAAGDGAQIVSYAPERVEVRTTSTGDALLVLSDAYYPGWRATVDGVERPIVPTNVLFRGVEVSAGEHTVVFTYTPAALTRGLWLAALGVILFGVLLAAGAWRERQPARAGV